jgi:hypothetical protein
VSRWDDALLFRTLATLRTEIPLFDDVDELRWKGPAPAFEEIGKRLDAAITEKAAGKGREASQRRTGRAIGKP